MRHVIRSMKTVCMWIALIVLGTSLMDFAVSQSVWYLGLILMDPVKALAYLAFASIITIGVFQLIDKIPE